MVRLRHLPLLILLAVLLVSIIPIRASTNLAQFLPTTQYITIQKTAYQAVGGGCYNAQATLLFNSTATSVFTFDVSRIFLVETGTNVTVVNRPNYVAANNTLSSLIVFPSVPVYLVVMFNNFCIIPTSNLQILLFVGPNIKFRVFP